ncbi:hypothetical protein [Pseudoduganella sp. GCM10020061]|uniref:hypothetical protein n=1 Tax=Pseudoduganella sp. GCM10020061 TaxID=3317345 RepID=UPI00363FD711
MSEVAFIVVHGMGETPPSYADKIFAEVERRVPRSKAHIAMGSVYYQKILQDNETEVWNRVSRHAPVNYDHLRRFLLYGFGDAAGLENGKEFDHSPYEMAQLDIARTLLGAREHFATNPRLVLLTHSLGCQVMSNYIYDAQKSEHSRVNLGIWKDIQRFAFAISGRPELTRDEIAFLRADTCTGWISTGCNIPIFVAAHKNMLVIPIRRPNDAFRWLNIYDPDDVLGWPLQPLSPGYRDLVEDRVINAGAGMIDWVLKSWNPLSHQAYWGSDEVLDPLEAMLRV